MKKYKKAPKIVQDIFNFEWKRTKRMCKPFFNSIQKPRLYVAKILKHGWLGYHSRRIRGDMIVIRESHLNSPDLLNTIRHEICHAVYHNHKRKFQTMLRGLNEKAPSPENA